MEHEELQRVVGDPPAAAIYSSEIAADTSTGSTESERLARRFFTLYQQSERAKLLELMHPEIEWVLMTIRPGEILRGREEAQAFLDEIAEEFIELVAEEFTALDEERVVVEGRRRTIDDERVLRDDPMILAMVFRDGLLRRSTPAQSVAEAEAILSAESETGVWLKPDPDVRVRRRVTGVWLQPDPGLSRVTRLCACRR